MWSIQIIIITLYNLETIFTPYEIIRVRISPCSQRNINKTQNALSSYTYIVMIRKAGFIKFSIVNHISITDIKYYHFLYFLSWRSFIYRKTFSQEETKV